jgi:hypothetical protein
VESAFPEIMVKAGVIYSNKPLTVGIYNSFFDAPPKYPEQWNTPYEAVNPEPKSYNLLTVNVTYDISKLLDKEPEQVMLSAYVDNILDEQIDYPEFSRNTINSQPLRGGTSVYGTIAIKF